MLCKGFVHMTILSQAFDFAVRAHQGQFKKETKHPFIYHPMAVASFVLQYGGDESQASAALIHDTIGDFSEQELAAHFGAEVAALAYGFSDPELPENPTWKQTKEAYLRKVMNSVSKIKLIIACEELHDLKEVVNDCKYHPETVWKRYPVSGREVLWYYQSLREIMNTADISQALKKEFDLSVRALESLL